LGPDPSVQAIYLKTVPDPAVRLLEFQTYRLDLGEYPTAPLEVFQEMETNPNLNVFQYDYPASNPIWVNFNNPYLSNRLIRKAIAHAVPYDKIFAEILPSWGVETAYPGKTYVLPNHYYTEPNTGAPLVGTQVHLFNTELEANYYDLDKALDYMELWWYSNHGDGSDSAVGDSDFSGLVDLDDYLILVGKAGVTESWPIDVVPGNMIDPDFDNSGTVTRADDLPLWSGTYGVEY
jgi:ABC-type transport system substrate-binding protein